MKAKDLIEMLKKLPGETEVVLPGQSGGFNSSFVISTSPQNFLANYYVQDYLGDHEILQRATNDPEHKTRFKGYILMGVKQHKSMK